MSIAIRVLPDSGPAPVVRAVTCADRVEALDDELVALLRAGEPSWTLRDRTRIYEIERAITWLGQCGLRRACCPDAGRWGGAA